MSAQIIQLSDHRNARRSSAPLLINLSLSIFFAYFAFGATIYAAMIEATREGFGAPNSWR